MRTVILDASIIKWIFPDRPQESHSHLALQILQHIKEAHLPIISFHFISFNRRIGWLRSRQS